MNEIWYYIRVEPTSNKITAVQQAYEPGIDHPEYFHVDRDPMALISQKVTRLEKVSSDPDIYSFDCEPFPPEEPEQPPAEPTEPDESVANP